MNPSPNQTKSQPNLEISPDLAAVYANLVRIAHSPAELVLDFAHLMPGLTTAQVRARVVMSPLGAKLLQRALRENLQRYESAFGEIKVPGDPTLADHLFGSMDPSDGDSNQSKD